MNIYLDLFWTFAKIGAFTFGGGAAMLPILQQEIVDKKGWCSEEELTDYYAIGQCTPGIIAVNTATFVGVKQKGNLGGVVATLGVVFPSVVIITIIAAFLRNFAGIPAVQHAFVGIRAAVVALIASSVLKLTKTTVKDAPSALIFLVVVLLSVFDKPLEAAFPTVSFLFSPVVYVLLAGCAGLAVTAAKGGLKK